MFVQSYDHMFLTILTGSCIKPLNIRGFMKTPEAELFGIAESQQGYFTFQQVITAGFSDKNHAYQVQAGDWVKVFRGIYRLANDTDDCTPVAGSVLLFKLLYRSHCSNFMCLWFERQ